MEVIKKEEPIYIEHKVLDGCQKSPKDYRDYTICSANAQIEYPEEFILDNLPKVKNQNQTNSCAGHASSSILEWYDKNQHDLSTEFIYGIQKSECGHFGQGMMLKDVCSIINRRGDMLLEDCPGNNEVPICWGFAEAALSNKEKAEKAYYFRVDGYYLCNTDNDIKYALMNYGPVLGGMMFYNRYYLDKDYAIRFDTNSGGGGHAIMICGWNKIGWIIQNSWGEGWGNKGRFVIPYNTYLFEARALIDHINEADEANKVFKTNAIERSKNKFGKFIWNLLYKVANWAANKLNK